MILIERMRRIRREKDEEIATIQAQIAGIKTFHGGLADFNRETGQVYEEILPSGEFLRSDTVAVIKRGILQRPVTVSEVKLQAVMLGANALVDYHRFTCNPKERGVPVRLVKPQ